MWLKNHELGLGIIFSILIALVLAGVSACEASDAQDEAQPPEDMRAFQTQASFAIDERDVWEMHQAGLPSKSDVLNWHMSGKWGYQTIHDGKRVVVVKAELPGGSEVWDKLYGLDHSSGAYKYI